MLFLLIYFPPLFLFTSDTLFHCILFLRFLFWVIPLLPTLFLLTHFLFYLFFSVFSLLPNPFSLYTYFYIPSIPPSHFCYIHFLPFLIISIFFIPPKLQTTFCHIYYLPFLFFSTRFLPSVLFCIHIFHSSFTRKPLFITSIFFRSSFFHLVSSPPQPGEATVLPRQPHSGCRHYHPPVQGLPGRACLLLRPGHVLGHPSAWWLLRRPLCRAFKSSEGGGSHGGGY